MILAALITYLLGLDLGVGVYSEAPSDKSPNEYNEYYYVLEQTGSSTTNQIVTTTIAIQSYAPSLLEAMVISKDLEKCMETFAETSNYVARVELVTDYNFTNTATKQYRWQAVYNITHYKFD